MKAVRRVGFSWYPSAKHRFRPTSMFALRRLERMSTARVEVSLVVADFKLLIMEGV